MNILDDIIYKAIDEFNQYLNGKPSLVKSPQTELYGPGSNLDSLELVNFIVAVEDKIEAQTGLSIRVVSDKAMSRKSSPFKTAETLANFVSELIEDEKKK